MEIKIPIPAVGATLAQGGIDHLKLQLNQQLEAVVLKTDIAQNQLTLQLAGKTIHVEPNQAVDLVKGQTLTLLVTETKPAYRFKIIPASYHASGLTEKSEAATAKVSTEVLLKQVLPRVDSQPKTAPELTKQLVKGELLQIRLIEVSDKKITGQVFFAVSPKDDKSRQFQHLSLNLTRKQILTADKSATLTLQKDRLITLEVVKGGDRPQFKLIEKPLADTPERIINDTFKRYLPTQESATVLLNRLTKALPSIEADQNVPETLKRLARELLQSLPQKSQMLEPRILKQQIANSGRFLEAGLSRLLNTGDINLKQDFKLKLLRLIDILQQQTEPKGEQKAQSGDLNLFKEILQQSNNTLAKIVLDQLNSLPKEDGAKQSWLLELPFFQDTQIEKVAIEIELEKHPEQKDQKNSWLVNISVTPPDLGTIHCRISNYDTIVSTRFWSEKSSTVAKINRHIDYLREQLENNGIHAGIIDVQHGKPLEEPKQGSGGGNLVSETV